MTFESQVLARAASIAGEHLSHPKLWIAGGFSAEQTGVGEIRCSSIRREVVYVVAGVDLEALR